MSVSQPYVHVEKRRRSILYREKSEATKAAETLYRKSKAIGWHVYSRASLTPIDQTVSTADRLMDWSVE
jgi:hypothetical protein